MSGVHTSSGLSRDGFAEWFFKYNAHQESTTKRWRRGRRPFLAHTYSAWVFHKFYSLVHVSLCSSWPQAHEILISSKSLKKRPLLMGNTSFGDTLKKGSCNTKPPRARKAFGKRSKNKATRLEFPKRYCHFSHSWFAGVSSTVALEGKGVATLPGSTAGRPDEVVRPVPPHTHTAVLPTGRGEAAALAVLHDRLSDPVDPRVVADGIVPRVHGDHLKHQHLCMQICCAKPMTIYKRISIPKKAHFLISKKGHYPTREAFQKASAFSSHLKVFERSVLIDPVRVQNTHVRELGTHALLGDGPQVTDCLDLVDTVVLRLTCY